MEDIYSLNVSKLGKTSFNCNCGRKHSIDIENILIGSGVIDNLSELLKGFNGDKVFIVADKNTYNAAGEMLESTLKDEFKLRKHIFQEEQLIPDEKALGTLLIEIPEDTSAIIALGSGTINDISRILSYKLHKPYIVVCTAPSMDGYASTVSPLIKENVKITYDAVYPHAIVADIGIVKEAPLHMLHAGFGDILGKYTALADWHLANLLKGEYFCERIEKLVIKALNKCVEASGKIAERDAETISTITEALILSGMAIGMTATSRPASGEEHHLSHCWEMVFMDRGIHTKWLHGNNVGVGVGVIIEAYNFLSRLNIEDVYASGKYRNLDKDRWSENLKKVYGKAADYVQKFKENSIAFEEHQREENMKVVMDNWEGIREICTGFLPCTERLREIIRQAGAQYEPQELGIDRELFRNSFIAAKDVRKRYGVLQLLEDIGMLEEAAEAVTEIYYK